MMHKLEIGDKIAVLGNSGNAVAIWEVSRVTDTMAFCKVAKGVNTYELKFARQVPDGDGIFTEKGDTGWHRTWYRLAKEGDFEHIKKANKRIKISRIDWQQVSIEKIEQILQLLEQ